VCCTGCAEQGVGLAEQRAVLHAAQGKEYCTRAGRAVHGTGCAEQGGRGVAQRAGCAAQGAGCAVQGAECDSPGGGQSVLHREQNVLYKRYCVLHRGRMCCTGEEYSVRVGAEYTAHGESVVHNLHMGKGMLNCGSGATQRFGVLHKGRECCTRGRVCCQGGQNVLLGL
jgi:hypothetical protein